MTHREIAKILGISPAALSLIINNKPGISDTRRAQILLQIEQMGFSHLVQRNLPSDMQNNNLCFLIYKKHGKILDQHPFFLLLMESIEKSARKHGYNILLTTIDSMTDKESYTRTLKEQNAKGLIIFATEMEEVDIMQFENLNLPFVAIDNDFSYLNINTVSINNQMGTHQAIKYLYEMGHRKIGYLQSNVPISSFLERTHGYKDALLAYGLQFNPDTIFQLQYTQEGSYQDFKALLGDGINLPTAFVTDDDTIALGVMRALSEQGISVPGEVSFVGFNDRPDCEAASPKLTSINVPRYSFGSESIDLLIRLLAKDDSSSLRCVKQRIGTQLSIRESVKYLA